MPARSHLYRTENFFSLSLRSYVLLPRSHFIFTLMMGKTPAIEQQHHVEVLKTT
jgi:hypothetical protein